jgi:hypothetical protein
VRPLMRAERAKHPVPRTTPEPHSTLVGSLNPGHPQGPINCAGAIAPEQLPESNCLGAIVQAELLRRKVLTFHLKHPKMPLTQL